MNLAICLHENTHTQTHTHNTRGSNSTNGRPPLTPSSKARVILYGCSSAGPGRETVVGSVTSASSLGGSDQMACRCCDPSRGLLPSGSPPFSLKALHVTPAGRQQTELLTGRYRHRTKRCGECDHVSAAAHRGAASPLHGPR